MRVWILLAILVQILACCFGQPLSEYLWQETSGLQQQALKSAFIDGLRTAELDPVKFGVYNMEDAVYCYHTKQVVDIALKKSKDPELTEFLKHKSQSADAYAKSFMKLWHIEDIKAVKLGPACQNYVNHLYDVANGPDAIYIIPALTPCAKLWPWLGKEIDVSKGNFGPYTKWAKESLDPTYEGYKKYDKLMDSAEKSGIIERSKALDAYKKSMEGEVAFFGLDETASLSASDALKFAPKRSIGTQ